MAPFRWLRLHHFLASLGFLGVGDVKLQREPVLYRKCPSRCILLTEMRWYSERSGAQAKEIEGKSTEEDLGEMILSWRDRHIGRKRKSSAWLASPTSQTASRNRCFGYRCGAGGGRKVSSLARGVPPNPSQLPSVTPHFWKHCRFGVLFQEHLSAISPCCDRAEQEIRWDHSLEPVVQLQAVAGSVVRPGIRESSSFLPCFLAVPFQDAVAQRKHSLLVYYDIYISSI